MPNSSSEARAKEYLQKLLKFDSEVATEIGGDFQESFRVHLAAQNVLREELGHFGEYDGARYSLSDSERNILLAHGRQDAAAASLAAGKTLDRLIKLDRSVQTLKRLSWVSFGLVAALLLIEILHGISLPR